MTSLLEEAKSWGWERREEIAEVYSRNLSLPRDFLLSYLDQNIDYRLTDRHIAGLGRFYSLAAECGLIPQCRPLQFLGPVRAGRTPVPG